MVDWKQQAIEAAEIKAANDESARQDKIARRKEKARLTFCKYLTNCGVPFTETDIQFEIMKLDEVRTFAVIDGVEFSARKQEFEYEGCGVVQVCDRCGTRLVGYTVNNPADLGKALTNPLTPYHSCDPFATTSDSAEPETASTKLLTSLRDFIAENSFQG